MSLALLRLPLIFGEILVRYSSQGARLSRSRFSFHTSLPPPRARSLARVISPRRLPAAGPAPPPPALPRPPPASRAPARASRRRRKPWRSRSSSSSSSPVARSTSSAAEMDERARPRSLARLVGDGGVRRGEVAAECLSGVIPRARATSRRLARRASAGRAPRGAALPGGGPLSTTSRASASRAREGGLSRVDVVHAPIARGLDERRALRGEVVDDRALPNRLRRLELAEVEDERGKLCPAAAAAAAARCGRRRLPTSPARGRPRARGAVPARGRRRNRASPPARRGEAGRREPSRARPCLRSTPATPDRGRPRATSREAPRATPRSAREEGSGGGERERRGGDGHVSARARAEKKRTGEETNNADRVAHRSLHAVEPSARPGVRPGRGRVARRHPAPAPAPETGRRAVEDLRREPSARPTTDFVGDDDGDW